MRSKKFGMYKTSKDAKTTVDELMKVPKRDSKNNAPSTMTQSVKDGYVHQADLLYLPDDKGYKYALVVVDVGSGLVDAEPLDAKTQIAVKKAFEKIYSRKILSIPKALLQIDQGTEFNGPTAQYFTDNNVMIRRAKVARHRQVAKVEAYNGVIARAIFFALHEEELKTKEVATSWTHNLPEIIDIINKHMKEKRKAQLRKSPPDLSGKCEGQSCNLLSVGQNVRVISEEPKDTTGIKLKGRFRTTDVRWEPEVRQIDEVVLKPGQPPMYKITGIPKVNYTYNQLHIVK